MNKRMPLLTRYVLGIAATAAVLFLLWYFSSIVFYILLSAVLAIMGRPLVSRLERLHVRGWRMPRSLASLLTLLVMWVLFGAFFSFFIPLVISKLSHFSQLDLSQVIGSVNKPLQALQEHLDALFALPEGQLSLTEMLAATVRRVLDFEALNNMLGSLVSVASSLVVALFSITFITYFFLKEEGLFYAMVLGLFPARYEENVRRALDSVTVLLVRYFTGILAESFILMIIVSSVLMLFGAGSGNAFFTGLVVGILNVIPYVGPLIGFGIGLFVGLVSPIAGMTLVQTLLVTGLTIGVAQLVDNFVLQPVLYSNRVKAHPLEIFIVILIAGSVAGVVGMLLAIPSYTVLRVFAKEFFNNFKLVRQLTDKI